MIKLDGMLVKNSLTREDILSRCEVTNTNAGDAWRMCETVATSFGLEDGNEAAMQFMRSNVLLDKSVKFCDKDSGEIYGLLTLSEFNIAEGSPIMLLDRELGIFLSKYKQLNGHSFILDERVRNSGIDKKMLMYDFNFLRENYDFIWCGVENTLKSHNYWKRIGFVDILTIDEATFYLLPLNEKLLVDSIY